MIGAIDEAKKKASTDKPAAKVEPQSETKTVPEVEHANNTHAS